MQGLGNVVGKDFRAALLVGLIPLFIYLANKNFFYINFYQPPWFDPYVYLALFRHTGEYMSHVEYYPATRVPYIILGALFHHLFSPVVANDLFKLTLSTATVVFFYLAARCFVSLPVAVISAVLLATYPYFISSMGWDYVESAVLFYGAIQCWCMGRGRHRPDNVLGELTIGLAYAFMLGCNLYAAALAPWSLALYFGLLWQSGRTPRELFKSLIIITAGGLCGLILISFLSGLMGGSYWFLSRQISMVFALRDDASWSLDRWAFLLPHAIWAAIPIVVGVVAAIWLACAAMFKSARPKDSVLLMVAGHYVVSVLVFGVTTLAAMAVFAFWFYTNFLLLACFLTLAVLLEAAGIGRVEIRRLLATIVLVAVVAVALYVPEIGKGLQKALSITYGGAYALHGLVLAAAAAAFLFAAAHFRSAVLVGASACAIAYLYLNAMTNAQVNHTVQRDRRVAYEAVLDASDEIRDWNRNGQVFVWIDRGEEPNGPIFHGIYINSLLSAKLIDLEQATRFPKVPPDRFKPGRLVAILTSSADWKQRADATLADIGLRLNVKEDTPISHGDIQFRVVKGVLDPV